MDARTGSDFFDATFQDKLLSAVPVVVGFAQDGSFVRFELNRMSRFEDGQLKHREEFMSVKELAAAINADFPQFDMDYLTVCLTRALEKAMRSSKL